MKISPFVFKYGLAVVVSIFSVGLHVKIHGTNLNALPTFFLALTISSCYGGWGPGLLASAILSTANLFYFIPPDDSFAIQSTEALVDFVLFSVGSLLISSITSSLYASRESLRRANKEVLEYARQKLYFVSNVTHEIRTPLNAIVGLSRILAESKNDSTDHYFLIQKIQDASEILLNQVNDILDYSKLESGKFEITKTVFNLSTQVRRSVDLVKPLAKNKKLQLILNVDPELSESLVGDANRILQILWNLLSNAIKFTSHGNILISAKKVHDFGKEVSVRFEVTDSGIGISKEDQEKIFLPFIQAGVSAERNFGGTGLGLSICKKLVKIMGGQIGVISEKDQGSTFWFTLQLQKTDLPAAGQRYFKMEASGLDEMKSPYIFTPAQQGLGSKILAVDDNEINLLVMQKFADKLGYAIDVAETGTEAIDLCAKNKYVTVLMDCQIPKINGFAATRAIRSFSNAEFSTVPIIATTAYTSKEVREQCRLAGMDDYMAKPIDFDEFAAKLKFWSENRSSAQPVSESPSVTTSV